jgi:hypothetical protein
MIHCWYWMEAFGEKLGTPRKEGMEWAVYPTI